MTEAGIPEAWPLLLSREQLRAYLGGIGDATLRKVCPIAPVDLGANVLRYYRAEVDAWVAGLSHRGLRAAIEAAQDAPAALTVNVSSEPQVAASVHREQITPADRARARANGGQRWKKSATSSASARAN